MRKSFIVVAGALVALTAPIVAQQSASHGTTPGQPDSARVAAGSYVTDPAHTLVGWRVNHMGFSPYFGQFGDVKGTLTLDPKSPDAAKLDVTIPIASLSSASAKLNEHLLGTDFFDATKFPEARFVSTSVKASGTTAVVAGNLTLHGITKPVTLNVKFFGAGTGVPQAGGKPTIGFEATGTINRADFGMTYGLPFVPDPVELDISAAFEKQG